MTAIDELLSANDRFAISPPKVRDARPKRHLAVLTCMDARIDVLSVLGLDLGDAHVLRNAGGRVTEDVLRSLALSTHVLGIDTVVVMEHSRCGLAGVTDEELRAITGADMAFLPIDDHKTALREDVARLASTPFLAPILLVAGLLYDVDTGRVEDVVRFERPADADSPAIS